VGALAVELRVDTAPLLTVLLAASKGASCRLFTAPLPCIIPVLLQTDEYDVYVDFTPPRVSTQSFPTL
jgi:hypothetical protein